MGTSVHVAPGGCSVQSQWIRQSRKHVVRFQDSRGFCGLMHAKGHSAKTGHFTNSHIKCLHPETGSGHECGKKSLLTHLLKHRIKGYFLGISQMPLFPLAFTHWTFINTYGVYRPVPGTQSLNQVGGRLTWKQNFFFFFGTCP